MSLVLTNSFGGCKEVFIPHRVNEVRMYVCGPTVYNYAHIGNARPAVVFDILARVLRRHFKNVIYARNLTDVDDKINAAALAEGVPIGTITQRYTRAYHDDMSALGVLPPSIEPKVTDHIAQIIALIGRLIAQGHAYEAQGHVLFHIPSFAQYGALSGRSLEDMIAGARVEVVPFKKHPADFVLWKPSKDGQVFWDSPWGRGRPGWHIECSAMIEQHLGTPIDIHGGGQDLIFPHHENEIAQGTRARYWIHNGFITVEGRKMSKSVGNVLLVRDLLNEAPGEAIRYALLSAHYRQPLDWTAQGLQQAKRNLDRLYGVLRELEDISITGEPAPYLAGFYAALDDDLNTPAALAEIFRLARMVPKETSPSNRASLKTALLQAGKLLGLLEKKPSEWFQNSMAGQSEIDVDVIEALIGQRETARAEGDFEIADRIRDDLRKKSILLEDRDGCTQWRRMLS